MDLSHQFTVPTGVEETWAHFQDIAGLAECFPGATVTAADGDSFSGSVKVKLGPIALVYNGSGTFVEKDDAAHRFVVDAKGKDKRGNGTAGAVVTLSMSQADGGSTAVDVRTDLNITGKPAQFGRSGMQDVSDKLLGQFVTCLEQRLTAEPEPEPESGAEPAAGSAADLEPTPVADAAAVAAADKSGPSAVPEPSPITSAPSAATRAPAATASRPARPAAEDDALDLGATVIPVLLRTYQTQIAAVLGLVVGVLVGRRRRG